MTTKRFVAKFGLDNNNQTITNVASPVNSSDVATKNTTDGILTFAQAAYNAANNVAPQIQPAFDKANSAYDNTIYLQSVNNHQNTRILQTENDTVYLTSVLTDVNSKISFANTWLQSNDAHTLSSAQSYTDSANAQLKSYSDSTFFAKTGGSISGSVVIDSSLLVTGNLTVTGNVTSVSANNLSVQDNMFYLNANNYVTNPDLGFAGNYNDGTYQHAGFFRDHSSGVWKVFDSYLPEPDASPYIDTSNSSFRLASIQANTFIGSGVALSNIPNSSLVNTSITINGTSITLGESGNIIAGALITDDTISNSTRYLMLSPSTNGAYTVANTSSTKLTYNPSTGTLSASVFSGSGASLTSLTAGNLSGTIPSAVLGNSTAYVGTTAIALNRSSGSQTLTGVSIDGNAATVTNGLTTSNYNSYAPTLTGTGASGTWGISITGSAGSATTATNTSGGTVNGNYLGVSNTTGSTGYGLSLYNGATAGQPQYGLFFGTTANWGTYGNVSADWATYFTMDSTANRGWVFRDTVNGNKASISNLGDLTLARSLGVGTTGSGTAGEIRATNNITAYYSDKRLKENIKVIPNALNKVLSLSGVTFTSNDIAEHYGYKDKKEQVGVIAQEVESVLPQIVVPAPFDIGQSEDGTEYSISGQNYKTVQYEKLVPLLIEAIKDQQNQIDELKQLINNKNT